MGRRLPEDHHCIHGYTTVQADARIAAPEITVRMEAASTGSESLESLSATDSRWVFISHVMMVEPCD